MSLDTGAVCVNVCIPGFFFLMGCFVIYWTYHTYMVRQGWSTGTGVVQGYRIVESSDSDGTTYSAAVDFTYDTYGQTLRGSSPLGSGNWSGPRGFAKRAISRAQQKSPVGSPIDLIVDPANPRKALPAGQRRLGVGTILFGMVFVATGMVWITLGRTVFELTQQAVSALLAGGGPR